MGLPCPSTGTRAAEGLAGGEVVAAREGVLAGLGEAATEDEAGADGTEGETGVEGAGAGELEDELGAGAVGLDTLPRAVQPASITQHAVPTRTAERDISPKVPARGACRHLRRPTS
jgi:hypothetical protein